MFYRKQLQSQLFTQVTLSCCKHLRTNQAANYFVKQERLIHSCSFLCVQKPTINHVTITVPDAIASNGVVHVIGDTLFPVPVGDVFEVLENCTSFSKFRDYVKNAGLQDELKNIGEF